MGISYFNRFSTLVIIGKLKMFVWIVSVEEEAYEEIKEEETKDETSNKVLCLKDNQIEHDWLKKIYML